MPNITKNVSYNLFLSSQAIQALGTAIYKALDFGLSQNEEPHLSPDLETLIELMTDQPADDDEGIDDEGIDVERDSDDSQGKDPSILLEVIDVSSFTCRQINPFPNAGGF